MTFIYHRADCGYAITTPNGDTVHSIVERDDFNRGLVTNCASSLVNSNTYTIDALSCPTARTTGTTGCQPVQEGTPIGEAALSPLQSYTYTPAGDLLATHTYTNSTDYTTETYAYDLLGNRIATTDALGNTTYRTYDPLGKLTAEWGATYPVRYTYDTAGRRTSLTTFRTTEAVALVATDGDTTTWTFDPATGFCTVKTYADNSANAYTYTSDGKPLRTTYASGRWRENAYNAKRELASVEYSDGEVCSFAYDAFSHEVAASNSFAFVQLLRNDYGQVTNEVTMVGSCVPHDRTIERSFGDFGRLTENDGSTYTYAPDGQVATISNGIAVVEYLYTVDRLDAGYSLTLSNGLVFTRSLMRDAYRRSLVTNITNSVNGIDVETFSYAYDALNRPTSRNADTFGYNDRSEVTSATIGGNYETHEYDSIGNSIIASMNGTTNTYSANNLNQYTSILRASAPPHEPTYDLDGNLLSDGVLSFTYDAANRLKTVSTNGIQILANFYDAKSRRVKKVTSEATTTFFYDDWNLIEERVAYTNGTTSTIRYFWGKDISGDLQDAGGVGGLLYITVSNSSTPNSSTQQLYIPCYDNNGNITRYLDANGNTVAQYTYDAFGNIISKSGPLADFFRHRFSTKYYDAETRLYYYGYRFYHTSLMRWLNRDPIEEDGGANLYVYCRNNVLTLTDILGAVGVRAVSDFNTGIFERIFTGNKFHQKEVANANEIPISQMKSRSLWGQFIAQPNFYGCEAVITLSILIRADLPEYGNPNTTYFYVPHVLNTKGISSTSDGTPQVRGAVLAHERGHAEAFFTTILPRFKALVRELPSSNRHAIESRYKQAWREGQAESARLANDAQINWYRTHGYKVEIKK